jgi:hypothetical protein
MRDVVKRSVGATTWLFTAAMAVGMFMALPPTRPAYADEAKTPIRASMFLNMTAPRIDSREAAYDQTLKGEDPRPKSPNEPEVLPDGSVRYGKTTVTVRNPCPPGSGHYEPLPVPGRRARN